MPCCESVREEIKHAREDIKVVRENVRKLEAEVDHKLCFHGPF